MCRRPITLFLGEMATDTYYMDEDVCTHQNKEYFTEEEKREGHTKMSGYCIDCGEPFSDTLLEKGSCRREWR